MAEFEIAIEQRKYLVQEKIASGGHAEVFCALVDSKTVAVKRFFREIASAAALRTNEAFFVPFMLFVVQFPRVFRKQHLVSASTIFDEPLMR